MDKQKIYIIDYKAGNLFSLQRALLILGYKSEIISVYNKIKLVPFGEFLPLKGVLEKLNFKKITRGYNSFSHGEERNVINLGKVDSSNSSDISATQMVSVKDRLYEPVKRENKIRMVKISSSGVTVSGF